MYCLALLYDTNIIFDEFKMNILKYKSACFCEPVKGKVLFPKQDELSMCTEQEEKFLSLTTSSEI